MIKTIAIAAIVTVGLLSIDAAAQSPADDVLNRTEAAQKASRRAAIEETLRYADTEKEIWDICWQRYNGLAGFDSCRAGLSKQLLNR